MAYTSSLSEYIDEQRKKAKEKEDADKKAQAAQAAQVKASSSRFEKDDVVVKTPVIQDERKEAVQAQRDDIKSLQVAPPATKAPVTVARTPVVPNYLPNGGFTQNEPSPVQGPQPYQPPPDNPISNASNAWKVKDAPDILGDLTRPKPAAYQPPQVGLTTQRPDTGPADFITQDAPDIIDPRANAMTGQPGQQSAQPSTRSFLKSNALQPWRVNPLTVGEGQDPGGLLGDAQRGIASTWDTWNSWRKQPQAGADIGFGGMLGDIAQKTPAVQEFNAEQEKTWETPSQNMTWPQYLWANVKTGLNAAQVPRRLVEDTEIPGTNKLFGTNLTPGQVGEAGATVATRATNPFDTSSIWRNPKTFNTPSVLESKDALNKLQSPASSELPIDQYADLSQKASPAAAIGGWIKDTFFRNINESAAVNKYVDSLPIEQQNKVQVALTNIASGPESTKKAIDAILTKDQRVQQYTQQAQEAQAQAQNVALPQAERDKYSVIAAEKGKQAAEEKSMSDLDYVSKYRHPGADMLMGLFTDPLMYLPIDKAWQGYKAARAAKVFDVTAEQAQKVIPGALKAADALLSKPLVTQDATALVDAGARKASIMGPSVWDKFNPFAATSETRAQQATNKIWNAATQLMSNVTTKEDALRIVTKWLDSPMELIDGVQGLTSPAAQAASVDGVYRVGAGVIANDPLLKVTPVLKSAAERLKTLPSLVGEGPFNPVQFAGEIDNAVYEAARGVFGLDPVTVPAEVIANAQKLYGAGIPAGGLKPVLRRLSDGTGIIDYATTKAIEVAGSEGALVIPKGKVVGSTTPKVWYDAQQEFKALVDAASNASASPVAKAAQLPFQIQRAILSDMYLGLNPGHWVRNAASATATLLTDGLYGTKNQGEMIADLTHKFGVVPERELQNTIAGTGQDIPHWAERAVGENPYSKLVDAANEVWTGLTNVAGVPFGEQSFKLTSKYNSFQRLFRNAWKTPVETTYREGLEALGIAPDIANTLVHHIVDAGITGNKADVSTAARNVLSSAVIKQNLRELGIPDELLSIKGWASLNEVFGGHLPTDVESAASAVKQVFTDELVRRAKILNESPTQLGNYNWMATEIKQDTAAISDGLRQSGQASNVPKETVEQTVSTLAKQFEEGMTGVWAKFRDQLAKAPDEQSALNIAMDTWAKHSELKDLARRDVDELGKTASYLPQGAQRDAAWLKKWEETPKIYGKLIDDTQKLFQQAQASIYGVSEQPAEKVFNWWGAIERYTGYDDAAIQQARTVGLGLGAPTADNAAQFEQALSANRQLVDKSLLELYDAFRRNPTGESLDMIVHAQQKIDHMAAQAASFLQDELEAAKTANTGLAWKKYYTTKGEVWNQFFDNTVIHNKAVERFVTADGATAQYKNLLTWEDPMYGPMRVLAPDTKTIVDASNDAQKMVKFNTGTKGPRISEFKEWQVVDGDGKVLSVPEKYVPDEVKAAWHKVVNGDPEVQELADVAGSVSPVKAPVGQPYDAQATIKAQGGRTASQIADEARIAKRAKPPLEPLEESEALKKIYEAQDQIKGLEEARLTLRNQWDSTASANWQYPSLDTMVLKYNRKGIVQIPDRGFEDLYGSVIAGRRINGQKDIESLIEEYAQIRQQINASQKVMDTEAVSMKDLHEVAEAMGIVTKGNDEVLLDAINKELVARKMQRLRMANLGNPAQREVVADLLMKRVGAPQAPTIHFDPFKLEEGQDVATVLAENTTKSKASDGMKAPEVAEALGTHMINKLKQAEQTILSALPNILTGKPNALTEAQRIGAMDLLSELLPQYDNALAGASKGSSDMMNFAMLDPSNRRNVDVWLSHLFPFHYFWSRSAKNWAERILTKPGVVHAYYTAEKNIELENQQQNLPNRLQGTVPNPAAQFGIGPQRLGNPLAFALPFAGYYPSQYIDPEAANTAAEQMIMRVQQFTPGLMPMLKAAEEIALDKVSPNSDGSKRFQWGNYAPNKFIPAIDLAGYAYQAATGATAGTMPDTGTPTYGDAFDPYRTGRKSSELGIDGDPAVAQYAQQYAYNVQHGDDVNKNIPSKYQKQAADLYLKSTSGAASDRLTSKAGSFLVGVPGYNYSDAERKLQDEQTTLYGLGYDPINNPFGSEQAMNAYRAQHPELQAFGSKGSLVPGSEALPPGVKAQKTEYYSLADGVYVRQAQAVTDFLMKNPNATSKELADAKAPFYAELDTLKKKYADVLSQKGGGGGDYDTGQNPKEQALTKLESMLKFDNKAPEWPGDGATDAQLSEYYAAKGKWELARLDYLDKNLNQLKQEEPSYPQAWRDELNKMTAGEYSSELARKYQDLKYAPDAEKAWSAKNSLKEELSAANIQESKQRVTAALGAGASAALDAYFALPKGSEERRAYKQANPVVNQAIMLSFNPDEYAEVEKKFGKDAWTALFAKPKYPTDTSDAAKQAYYKQLDAYNAKYPNAEQIHLYVYGRPYKFDDSGDGGVNYDFGQDLAEINRLFPNIWKDKANFPDGADKVTIAKYMQAHPDLYGYKVWYDQHKDQIAPAGTDSESAQFLTPDILNYKGPRPVGSNRQPIGTPYADPASELYNQAPPVQKWDTSMITGTPGTPGTQAATVGATGTPQDAKTAQDYIEASEGYQKGVAGAARYKAGQARYQANQAVWKQRRDGVVAEFGEDAAVTWDTYGKLPKDSKARDDYRAAHPELRAYDMAAFNPKEYAEAKKIFGDTAWKEWALTPPYGESEEAKALRSQYYDAHPTAKILNAWLNGRPTVDGEQLPGEGVKYDFGKDFAAAGKLFGADIWQVFAGYKSDFSKEQRAAYFNQHPSLSQFFGWWYGNSQTGSAGAGYRGGFGTGRFAGVGHFYGGGGGGGGSFGISHPQTPKPRYMDKSLVVPDQQLERLRQWRPHNISINSLAHAGDAVGPENLKKWRRQK